MERIPLDIIINHIIPYTYNIQPNILLEDIKNYYTIKIKLLNDKYNTNIIKRELLSNCYMNKQKFNNILGRHFQIHSKNYDYQIIYKYSQNSQFNIVFGLLTREERTYFSEYILEELYQWIIFNSRP
jgi:hypothetical protein